MSTRMVGAVGAVPRTMLSLGGGHAHRRLRRRSVVQMCLGSDRFLLRDKIIHASSGLAPATPPHYGCRERNCR
jgi:hypothetical protein